MRGLFLVRVGLALTICAALLAPGSFLAAGADTSETGGLGGIVEDQDGERVESAWVLLYSDGDLDAGMRTDEDGQFVFYSVPVGAYEVRVEHPEFVPASRNASVDPDEMTILLFELQPLQGHEEHEWEGFVGCSLSHNLGTVDCPHEGTETSHSFLLDPAVKTLVVAMEWDKVNTSTTDRLRHWLYIERPDSDELRSKVRFNGPSAIEYRVDHREEPFGQFEHDFGQYDGDVEMEFVVSAPRAPHFDIVYEQPYTVHYHVFYAHPAPIGYSALP